MSRVESQKSRVEGKKSRVTNKKSRGFLTVTFLYHGTKNDMVATRNRKFAFGSDKPKPLLNITR